MGRNREKEFWLEPSPELSEQKVRELSDHATPDALVVSKPALGFGTKLASRAPGAEILITDNPEFAVSSKDSGKTVALEIVIRSQSDSQKVIAALGVRPDYLIVDCPDWKVIPLENLVAGHIRGHAPKLIAKTRNYEESRTALGALELGVDGIVLQSSDAQEAARTRRLVSDTDEGQVQLSKARIESVKPIRMGARVCVDTTELIHPSEGLLVGCSSQALFLVEGEVHTNPHVSPRPFRVNAGPVSLYVLTSNNVTRYLSDLEAGEPVLIVDKNGQARSADVARSKVERRPLVLVEAFSGGRVVKTILQNAETVRLVGPSGSIPVHTLKPGDEVYVRLEHGGRHFGSHVEDEMIVEK